MALTLHGRLHKEFDYEKGAEYLCPATVLLCCANSNPYFR